MSTSSTSSTSSTHYTPTTSSTPPISRRQQHTEVPEESGNPGFTMEKAEKNAASAAKNRGLDSASGHTTTSEIGASTQSHPNLPKAPKEIKDSGNMEKVKASGKNVKFSKKEKEDAAEKASSKTNETTAKVKFNSLNLASISTTTTDSAPRLLRPGELNVNLEGIEHTDESDEEPAISRSAETKAEHPQFRASSETLIDTFDMDLKIEAIASHIDHIQGFLAKFDMGQVKQLEGFIKDLSKTVGNLKINCMNYRYRLEDHLQNQANKSGAIDNRSIEGLSSYSKLKTDLLGYSENCEVLLTEISDKITELAKAAKKESDEESKASSKTGKESIDISKINLLGAESNKVIDILTKKYDKEDPAVKSIKFIILQLPVIMKDLCLANAKMSVDNTHQVNLVNLRNIFVITPNAHNAIQFLEAHNKLVEDLIIQNSKETVKLVGRGHLDADKQAVAEQAITKNQFENSARHLGYIEEFDSLKKELEESSQQYMKLKTKGKGDDAEVKALEDKIKKISNELIALANGLIKMNNDKVVVGMPDEVKEAVNKERARKNEERAKMNLPPLPLI